MVYLLGQSHRYMAIDYASVVLKIHEIDEKLEMVGQINMADFLKHAAHNRDVAHRVFNLLQMHFPQAVDRSDAGLSHPPPTPGDHGFYQPSASDLGMSQDEFHERFPDAMAQAESSV